MSATSDVVSATPKTSQLKRECIAIVAYLRRLDERNARSQLAALRRMPRDTEGPPPPEAFWAIIDRLKISHGRETFWQSVLSQIISCRHQPGVYPGKALRDARVSTARVERWLRLSKDKALQELPKLTRRIDAVDWVVLTRLLWYWDSRLKRQFARNFFAAPKRTPSSTESSTPVEEP